jgi:hypothetical protein
MNKNVPLLIHLFIFFIFEFRENFAAIFAMSFPLYYTKYKELGESICEDFLQVNTFFDSLFFAIFVYSFAFIETRTRMRICSLIYSLQFILLLS